MKIERFDLIPVGPLTELATHFGRGATKYDAHQWRVGYEWSKSYSAIQRHSTAFWAGYDYDVCENEPEACGFLVEARAGEKPIVLALDSREVQRQIDVGDPLVIRHKDMMYKLAVPVGSVPQGSTCYNHTGSHHMTCVAWHSFVLLEFKDNHPGHDDRYRVRTMSDQTPYGIRRPGGELILDPTWFSEADVMRGMSAWTARASEIGVLVRFIDGEWRDVR